MLESLVVNILNQFLKDYVSNLNYDQLKIGIWKGEVNLSNLKLRKDALDKLDLPISVSEGYIGEIKLVIPWSNLKSQPVKVIIDHIYLLAEPKNEKTFSVEEEEKRLFHLKQQRLETAELLDSSKGETKSNESNDGFLAQLTAKIINNLQFQIMNIHIRYEDMLSDPGHSFAVGLTLKELSGLSTDDQWQPKFISDPSSPINKLVTLESLSLYWNTDTKSLANKYESAPNVFTDMIPTCTQSPKDHQFLLKPVSGTGKVTLNQTFGDRVPKTDVTLLFDEIAFGLDDHQYRDCILMLDLFQANIKKQKYLKFRPGKDKTAKENPRDYFRFAAQAVLSEVHERHYKWSWDHFRTRRDQRLQYVECYMASKLENATDKQTQTLEDLERALSFQDIRFYRSIANVNLRKQKVQIEIEAQKKKAENAKKSWWGWATGASKASESEESIQMTEEQKKEFYEAIEYDEDKINVSATSNMPKDSIKLALKASLNRASFTLKKNPKKETEQELLSLVFDAVSADFTQYVESVKVGAALRDLRLFDGSSQNTIYPQLIGMKKDLSLLDSKNNLNHLERRRSSSVADSTSDPFFSVVFENKPLKSSASNALQLNVRPLEIIYNPMLIVSITEFFKPPSSKMDGVNAVMAAAESRLQQFKTHSRAGLEFAFEKHTTFDVDINIDAPIIFIPESLTSEDSPVLMINPGHIKVDSELVDKKVVEEIKTKDIQSYSAEDVKNLESLMYDKFNLQLTQTKIVIGAHVQECLQQFGDSSFVQDIDPCFIDHMDMKFSIKLCILPESTEFTKAKVSGHLPLLSINMSDNKYKMLMKIVDAATPKSATEAVQSPPPLAVQASSYSSEKELVLSDPESETTVMSAQLSEIEQFKFAFQVDKISVLVCETFAVDNNKRDSPLCEIVLEHFGLSVITRPMDLLVDLSLGALNVIDKMEHGGEFGYLFTVGTFRKDEEHSDKELLKAGYRKASKEHPKFTEIYDEYDQSVDLALSTFTVVITRSSILRLQNWATTAFTSPSKPESTEIQTQEKDLNEKNAKKPNASRMKVVLHMDSANIMLNNDGSRLATLGLHTGDLTLSLEPKTIDVSGKFGNLTLSDDAASPDVSEKFILSIVGDELARFSYKTFDSNDENPGYDQAVKLRMGSIKLVASNTIQPLMNFTQEFLEMKSIYDNAKSTAQETAQKYQQRQSKFHFDVLISSPLVVLPAANKEKVTAYLGEIRAKNEFLEKARGEDVVPVVHVECGLYKINVQSTIVDEAGNLLKQLPIIKDLDIAFDIENLEKSNGLDEPSSLIRGNISDVLMSLTEKQYKTLLQASDNLQRTFASDKKPNIESTPSTELTSTYQGPNDTKVEAVERSKAVKLDLCIELSTICLEILKDSDDSLDNGISKLSFNAISVKMQSKLDESMALEAKMQSIQFSDTRSDSKSKFREILPAQSLNGPQFQLKLHSYKDDQRAVTDMQAVIDSPKIILSLDYMLLLKDFFAAPLAESHKVTKSSDKVHSQSTEKKASAALNYDIKIVSFELICLSSPEIERSEAVVLCFDQLSIEQQDVLNLKLNGIGMFLCRMNNIAESMMHVIESLDVSLLVNNTAVNSAMTVNLQVKPIVLRLSYQDAMLITAIVNKILALAGNQGASSDSKELQDACTPGNETIELEVSKESLIASFEGLQIVLIEDLHGLPFIDFYVEPFEVVASDWSSAAKADVEFALGMKNFNFKNSHWEPLLEPWKCNIRVSQDEEKSTRVILDSKDFIYLNITHSFVESALVISQTLSQIKNLSDSAQVQVQPYLIVNSTGYNVRFWSMSDDADSGYAQVQSLENGQSMSWNFHDLKTCREKTNVSKNLLGIQIEENEWESILHVDIDREREFTYRLLPKDNDVLHYLIVQVFLEDHVKKVIFRSGLVLENSSSQDMELVIVDSNRRILSDLVLLKSQETYSVPIKMCYSNWIMVRPSDQYEWSSQTLAWSDMMLPSCPKFIECSSLGDSQLGVHLLQIQTVFDKTNPFAKTYPHMRIQFCAPLEIENLLPFDFDIALLEPKSNQRVSLCLQNGKKTHIHQFNSNATLNFQLALKSEKYGPSEVTLIKTNPGYNALDEKLVIKDRNGAPIHLRMHVSRTANTVGSLYIGIYAPYLVLNKSGFPLQLRSQQTFRQGKAPVESIPAYNEGDHVVPAIFSYSDISTRNRAQLSIDGSKWSEAVSFEAVGNSQGTSLLTKADSFAKHTGIKVEEGRGSLRLTKIVTISPRYILKNNMSVGIEICEFGTEGVVNIQPGQKIPFYQTSSSQVRWISIRRQMPGGVWSSPVNIQDIGKMYVKVDGEQNTSHLVRISVSVKNATLFSTFNDDTEWPYQIVNDSSVDIQFVQSDIDFDNSELKSAQKKALAKSQSFTLTSKKSLVYSWDVPVAKEKKLELCVGDKRRSINFEAVGSQVPFRYARHQEGYNDTLSMDVVARGSALVLHITDFDATKSLYRLKPSESKEAFETISIKHAINSVFEVNLAGLCLSVIDKNSQELALATIKRFEFKHIDSNMYQSIRSSIEWIQVDNQMFNSNFPILCYPSARPKVSNEQTTHPTLHIALDRVKDNQHGVQYYKIFSFLLQEMTLEVDETFLYALIDFAQFEGVSISQKQRNNLFLMEMPEPSVEKESVLYYFEEFCIQPMRLNLSFVRDEKADTNDNTQISLRNSPVGYVFNVLTMTIGNVNDAPIKLNALMVDNLRASSDDLSSRISLHYREQAMYQVHRVLGSIDILGNPVGLFNNLSSGFGELFYEPYQGFIMSDRPQDLGIGVAKGMGGFMKKSVFGVTDSLSRLTGSLGKGLSAATMDKKFQDKRRVNMNRNKPTHAVGGVTQGVGYFGASLASGITGLVTNPMEGASEKGAVGFIGGLGKGLVGAVTKPVSGLFDMTSNITAGIRETASSDGKVILRERLPRFIGKEGILTPYSQREALGQLWLKEVDDGSFFNSSYVAHGLLESEKEAMILTYQSIIVMRSDNLKTALHIPLESLESIDARADSVSLTVKKSKPRTFKFDKDTNGDWFAKKIADVLREKDEENAQ